MLVEENKALARRWIKAFGRDMNAVDEMLDANAVDLNPPPGLPPNRDGIKAQAALYGGAYPDLTFSEDEIIAEGDKVVTRWTARGTHKGELFGVPPTGKTVKVQGITISRYANGKIVETWTLLDQMGLMQQIGGAPSSAYAPH